MAISVVVLVGEAASWLADLVAKAKALKVIPSETSRTLKLTKAGGCLLMVTHV